MSKPSGWNKWGAILGELLAAAGLFGFCAAVAWGIAMLGHLIAG